MEMPLYGLKLWVEKYFVFAACSQLNAPVSASSAFGEMAWRDGFQWGFC